MAQIGSSHSSSSFNVKGEEKAGPLNLFKKRTRSLNQDFNDIRRKNTACFARNTKARGDSPFPRKKHTHPYKHIYKYICICTSSSCEYDRGIANKRDRIS